MNHLQITLAFLAILLILWPTITVDGQTTAFTYQGRLIDGVRKTGSSVMKTRLVRNNRIPSDFFLMVY